MKSHFEELSDRLERAADRLAHAGFTDEEQKYRAAAADVRAGLTGEQASRIEQELLLAPVPKTIRGISVLAAQGEYDSGGMPGDGSSADGAPGSGDNTSDDSSADQLLSTAFAPGLSDPYSPTEAGWSTGPQPFDPYTGIPGADAANAFTGLNPGDPFGQAGEDPTAFNPYTTGMSVDPFSGSQAAESYTGGAAQTDSPGPDPFANSDSASYGRQSMLSNPGLLAVNDQGGNPNVASDAAPNYGGGITVNGEQWAWVSNTFMIGDVAYSVFSSPDGTVKALQAVGGDTIYFVDENGAVSTQPPYPTIEILVPPGGSGMPPPPDFIPDPEDTAAANTSAQPAPAPASPQQPPPASPAPDAQSAPPPEASPQSAPSSQPPASPPPDVPDQNPPADSTQPGNGPGTGKTQEQIDEENWGVAKSGMWDSLVDLASQSPLNDALHMSGLPGLFDWAKSGPPAPTGDPARDRELRENYQAGEVVTMVVAIASPIGAEGLLESAEVAATKLPALEGVGMSGGGRFIGPTEQWLSEFGETTESIRGGAGSPLPDVPAGPNLADATPTGPSFEGLIDVDEFSNDPAVADRLSRARAFDIGEYRDLTGQGRYGRVGDRLDSDEALQNAFLRDRLGVDRVSDATRGNPAIALPPELHQTIRNLRVPDMQGLSAEDVLQLHLDQMSPFTPEYIVRTLGNESRRFIRTTF